MDDLKNGDPLTNLEDLEKTIDLFVQQLNTANAQKEQVKNELTKIDEAINGLTENLRVLNMYHEFVSHKGFAGIRQWMDSHKKEIAEAEKERIAEQKLRDAVAEKMENIRNSTIYTKPNWMP